MAGLDLPIVEPSLSFEGHPFQVEVDEDQHGITTFRQAGFSKQAWLLRGLGLLVALAGLMLIGVSASVMFSSPLLAESPPGSALAFNPAMPAMRGAQVKAVEVASSRLRRTPPVMEGTSPMARISHIPALHGLRNSQPAMQMKSPAFDPLSLEASEESQRDQAMTADNVPNSLSKRMQPGERVTGDDSGSTLAWLSIFALGTAGAFMAGRTAHSRGQSVKMSAAAASTETAANSGGDAAALQTFINTVNNGYEQVHLDFEEQFWGTKMALKDPKFTKEALAETKGKMENFLMQPEKLDEARHWLKSGLASDEQEKVLKMFERTFACYIMESEEAKTLREEVTKKESDVEEQRNKMKLGAELPGKGFTELSSVGLRNTMRADPDEAVRKACYEGVMSIGPFICANGFCDIVKMRNRMAKKLGYVDFYDYKVIQAEGFNKERLFEILDSLEVGTKDLLTAARARLAEEKGADALKAWNMSFMMAGDVTKKLDPYFPFEKAVENWARSFAAMGIDYKGATMNLDLLDRKHKYSNGFCHWPQPAWMRDGGKWQPALTNFTSLADPTAIGSGHTALNTLMHEAGHAAHFANVVQPSPLFSQERAPTSVAYAENQSMFLDSLVGDAAWRGRYARDRNGKVIPWELLEEDLQATKPYAVFALRGMIAVPYFEKALYELPEAEVTPERIQELAAEVELKIQGGPNGRPLLSVPHILSDEASCYYHGYVLAEMAVHQTREHFLEKHGHIVDNPIVGPTLRDKFWKAGNSEMFLDLVEGLTGKPLTGDAWVADLKEPLEEVLKKERVDYEEAVKAGPAVTGDVDLGMRVRIVDGDEVIADSQEEGTFIATADKFEKYVKQRTA